MFRISEAEYKKRFGKLPKREKSIIPRINSLLEEELASQMVRVGLCGWIRQYKFHPDRKWQLDFYRDGWGVEVQGGGWNAGRHNRNPITMGKDYEKFNAATEMGIKLLFYTGEQVKDGFAITQIERIFK